MTPTRKLLDTDGKRMKLQIILLTTLALMLACGGSGGGDGARFDEDTATGGQDSAPQPDAATDADGGEETVDPVACLSEADCALAQGAAPTCRRWRCDRSLGCVLDVEDNGLDCDDQNACTAHDKCVGGACVGEGVACDDGLVCTSDHCDPLTGCQHTPNDGSACNDGDMCTINDACQDGACTGAPSPACDCEVDADCAEFDDGDLCNGVKICVGFTCVTDAASIVDCSGEPHGPCEVVSCKATTGACVTGARPNGEGCSDGSLCTVNDACDAGVCVGGALDCADDNPCTDDLCDPAVGCVYAPNAAACDDGDLCTEGDACSAGACVGAVNPACQCNTTPDCEAFDDGNLCNGTLVCAQGSCAVDEATVITCDPGLGGACEEVFCETASGQCKVKPALDGSTCSDGSACTENDVCADGLCVGAPLTCADDEPCTTDSCDPATGCVFAPNALACDDGNDCTDDDACAAGACVGSPSPACQCTTDADCDDMEDGDLCNGTLRCQGNQCVVDPITLVICPAASGCTEHACVPQTGVCVEVKAADGTGCDDGNACTLVDQCDEGQCKGASPKICDDGNLCTSDGCDPTVGCQFDYNTAACDDGSACTDNDACAQGACVGTPNPECHCEDDAGCVDKEDGDLCNGTLICVEHKCVVDAETLVTCPAADPNGCEMAICDPLSGACGFLPLPDGKACSDLDACTRDDRCQSGWCAGGAPPVCDDDNVCTEDACDATLGCVHAFTTAACDDGDPCTEGDQCAQGLCQPGAANVCAETCQPMKTVGCGESVSWSTTGPGATDEVSGYACAVMPQEGPEYAFRFDAPYDGLFQAYLTNEDSQTNLFVLGDLGQGCDAEACLSWEFDTVLESMVAGDGFYLVVDSVADPAGIGLFELTLECVPEHELRCDDGVDEDEDGLTDCEDGEDCVYGSEACPAPECVPEWTLYCGAEDEWSTYAGGATDLVELYSCSERVFSASEYTYIYTAPQDGLVSVTLSDASAPLELFVMDGGAGACSPVECVTTGVDEVLFEAVAGHVYYVTVDGEGEVQASYKVAMTCLSDSETACHDKYDNDQDGLADCADEDCAGVEVCAPVSCAQAIEIGCDQTISESTLDPNATDQILSYGCASNYKLMDGPEKIYRLVAPSDGEIVFFLYEGTGGSQGVLIGPDADGDCDTLGACHDFGFWNATIQATAGDVIYYVVDNTEEDAGAFEFAVSCGH